MTDREMLELAALAYGFDVATVTSSNGAESTMICDLGDEILCEVDWNPRDDDGDSRRLEVKLGIKVVPYPIYREEKHGVIASRKCWAPPEGDNTCFGPEVIERYGDDPCAATRLAVLRVAAEIGRQMKEQSK